MTPEEKVQWIQLHHGQHFKSLVSEFKAIAKAQRRFDTKADTILDIMDRAGALVAPSAACKRGCSYCCCQAVAIFDWEAERIAKFSKQKRSGFTGRTLEQQARAYEHKQIASYAGMPCPFLAHNECSIYSVRPMACRMHFSLADDSELCNIVKHPGAKVPYFNFTQWVQNAALICLDAGKLVGDIREFFGESA